VRKKGWWRAYGLDDFSYVGFETEANRVLDFTMAYVPGLLQIPEYSRELFLASAVDRTDAQLADTIAVRGIRQQRLTSSERPLELVAVIDEPVAQLQAGGRTVDMSQAQWRTSSFSGTNGNGCVEVALLPDVVAVRDTKDRTRPPHVHTPAAWRAFLTAVRTAQFGS
jgi:hypothetical protein